MTSSSSFCFIRFQIFLMTIRSSWLACSRFPALRRVWAEKVGRTFTEVSTIAAHCPTGWEQGTGLLKPKSSKNGVCHLSVLPAPAPGTLPFLACPSIPSVLIFRDVRTRAKSVALNVTVPSELRGTFIATSL